MHGRVHPTPFADVNAVLKDFQGHIQTLLGCHFLGMYSVGSLALGGFDPSSSDIDFVVVTDANLENALVPGLQAIHEQFAASNSPWATKIEAVYVPHAALHAHPPATGEYPQIEKGMPLMQTTLEPGWVFQCWTLRERGVVVAGPEPRTLIAPIGSRDMAVAVVTIASEWLDAAHHDSTWLVWLGQRQHHVFVIQTLCRMLYSLSTTEVTSKLHAIQWAQHTLGTPWSTIIERAHIIPNETKYLSPSEVEDTIAFIAYTVKQGQRGVS